MASVPFCTGLEAIDAENCRAAGFVVRLLLPAGLRVLSGELAMVDSILDDPTLLAPFKPFFSPTEGRPSIPMESYVRMLFLNTGISSGMGAYARRSTIR